MTLRPTSRRQFIQGSMAAAAAAMLTGERAEAAEVDLALVLAVDISRSISQNEHRIQLEGYGAAFRSPEVIAAIAGGPAGAVAVTLMQWADAVTFQAVGWTLVRDPVSAAEFAAAVEALPYAPEAGTSIGGAIARATLLLEDAPFHPLRRVIDVSGDGRSHDSPLLAAARDTAVRGGITINGLPICLDGKLDVAKYYAANVVGGAGSFLVIADGFDSFPGAVRRKLALEIAGNTPNRLRSLASMAA